MPHLKRTNVLAALALGIAVSLSLASFILLLWRDFPTESQSPASSDSATVEQQLANMQQDIKTMRAQLDALSGTGTDLRVSQLRADLDRVDTRLTAIERVLMDNPTRALDLALLRQEIAILRATYSAELGATRDEINRVYDLMKWFIGLFMTLILAGIGYAVNNMRKNSHKTRAAANSHARLGTRDGRIIHLDAQRRLRERKSPRRSSRSS